VISVSQGTLTKTDALNSVICGYLQLPEEKRDEIARVGAKFFSAALDVPITFQAAGRSVVVEPDGGTHPKGLGGVVLPAQTRKTKGSKRTPV
jgi:hypothetical protein